MVIRRSAQRLEENRCHSHLQEEQKGRPGELQACQPHFDPQEGNGAANPRNPKCQENHLQYSSWIHQGLVMFDQLDELLQ